MANSIPVPPPSSDPVCQMVPTPGSRDDGLRKTIVTVLTVTVAILSGFGSVAQIIELFVMLNK